MSYKCQIKALSNEHQHLRISTAEFDEKMFRELAHMLVEQIPMDDLKKLMGLKKIDPSAQDIQDILLDQKVSKEQKEWLMRLRAAREVVFDAECVVPNELAETAKR